MDKPKHTLAEALLSETAAKVALYLGAFFVLAGAFILAAIVEVARLPILTLLTIAFYAGAFGLRKRLPQASFVLFAAGSLMIPILGGVLRDRLPPGTPTSLGFWSPLTALLGLLWAIGTWTHRSRAFSILSATCIMVAVGLFGAWTGSSNHLTILLLEITLVAFLGAVAGLRRLAGAPDGRPVLFALQGMQVLVLMTSSLMLAGDITGGAFVGGAGWGVAAATWLLASAFFALSNRLNPFPLFSPLSVAALIPAPLLLLETARLPVPAVRWIYIGWGVLLAYAGAWLTGSRSRFARSCAPYFVLGSILPLGSSLFANLFTGGWQAVASLAAGAGTYMGLTVWRRWWSTWAGALVLLVAAYLMLFTGPVLGGWFRASGWILLFSTLALLCVEAVARRRASDMRAWAWPPRVLGWVLFTLTVIASLALVSNDMRQSALVLGIMGAGVCLYAQVVRQVSLGYAGLASMALALPGVLILAGFEVQTLAFAFLALAYYAIGVGLRRVQSRSAWASVLVRGGLGLGCAISVVALLEAETASVVAVGLTAGALVLEGVLRRDVRLAVPADLLLAEAYVMALSGMDVAEPQFYAIGVALLGIVTHYVFLRTGANTGAMIAGILAQLILLSTTFLQLLFTERFLFFFILFFQALVLLLYGLVVRSRSFVLVPLPFSVLAVVTVAFSLLSGLSTALIIGCSGILLLGLGILALLLRDRLMRLTDRLGKSLGGWRG